LKILFIGISQLIVKSYIHDINLDLWKWNSIGFTWF